MNYTKYKKLLDAVLLVRPSIRVEEFVMLLREIREGGVETPLPKKEKR